MATMASCRLCGAEFALARLLDDWRCRCPSCDNLLAEDGAARATLLRKAAAADRLETQLIEALSEIAGIDCNLELVVAPTVLRLLTRIDWERRLQDDLSSAQRQLAHLREALQTWASARDEAACADDDEALSDEMRGMADQLRKVGDALDHAPPQDSPFTAGALVRAAAHGLDAVADVVASGQGHETALNDAIGEAAQAITMPNDRPSQD